MLVTEKLVLARPRSEVKSALNKEPRLQDLLAYYNGMITHFSRQKTTQKLLPNTRELLRQLLEDYNEIDSLDAKRVRQIKSLDNWMHGSDEVVLALVDLVVDLDIRQRT